MFSSTKFLERLVFRLFYAAVGWLCWLCLSAAPAWAQGGLPVPFYAPAEARYGYQSADGTKVLLPAVYEAASFFSGLGVARVMQQGRYQLINLKGKPISEQYDYIGWSDDLEPAQNPLFYSGLTAFKVEERWGLINSQGRVVMEPSFDSFEYFQANVAKIGIRGPEPGRVRFGVINSLRQTILPPEYEQIQIDQDLQVIYAHVRISRDVLLCGLSDLQGQFVLPPQYLRITSIGSQRWAAEDRQGKWGIYDRKGKNIFPHRLESIAHFFYGKAVACQHLRYGLIDTTGQIIAPFEYRQIQLVHGIYQLTPYQSFSLTDAKGNVFQSIRCDSLRSVGAGLFQFWLGDKWGLADGTGKTIFFDLYDDLSPFAGKAAVVSLAGRQGMIGTDGTPVVPLVYQQVRADPSGLFRAVTTDGHTEMFDEAGHALAPGAFDAVGEWKDGRYAVRQRGRWGYADHRMQVVIPVEWDDAQDFERGKAVVRRGRYYGVLDTLGLPLISTVLDTILLTQGDYVLFKDNGRWGTFSFDGVEQDLGASMPDIRPDGTLLLRESGKVGLVNNTGRRVLEPLFDAIHFMEYPGLVAVYRQGKRFFMDLRERTLPPVQVMDGLELPFLPTDPFIAVRKNGRYGFVDYMGRLRIANRYDSLKNFSEDLAPVRLGEAWGAINRQEELIIQPMYDDIEGFARGTAIVRNGRKYGVINRQNQQVLPIEYDHIRRLSDGAWYLVKNDRIGFALADGRQTVFPRYETLDPHAGPLLIVRQNGRYGLNSREGVSILLPEYDRIWYCPRQHGYVLERRTSPREVR